MRVVRPFLDHAGSQWRETLFRGTLCALLSRLKSSVTLASRNRWDEVFAMLAVRPWLINLQPDHRWTALHHAAASASGAEVQKLLDRGADVTWRGVV